MEKLKTVKEVCRLTGLTGKHLYYFHHEKVVRATAYANYSVEGNDGYKLYDEAAVAKLQQIAMYFELGLKRNEIKEIMLSPNYDVHTSLDELKAMLEEKRERIDRHIAAIEQLRLIGVKNGMISVVKSVSLEDWGKNIRALSEDMMKEYLLATIEDSAFNAYDAMLTDQLSKLNRLEKEMLFAEQGETIIERIFSESIRLLGFAGYIISASVFLGSLGEGQLAKEAELPIVVPIAQGEAALRYLQTDGETVLQGLVKIIADYHDFIGKPFDEQEVGKMVEKVKELIAEHFGIKTQKEYQLVFNTIDVPPYEGKQEYLKYVINAVKYYCVKE